MSEAFWKLVPKFHEEKAAEAERLTAEREQVQRELQSHGFLSTVFWPPAWKRRKEVRFRKARLDREIAELTAPVGFDLQPPRIGHDDAATAWFEKQYDADPEIWPLPREEMLDEMHGKPVWHLSEYEMLHGLDADWPKAGFPVPSGPGFGPDLARRMRQPLTAEEAVTLANEIETVVTTHFRETYAEYKNSGTLDILRAATQGVRAKSMSDHVRQDELNQAKEAYNSVWWLRFWGEHGYGFSSGSTPK